MIFLSTFSFFLLKIIEETGTYRDEKPDISFYQELDVNKFLPSISLNSKDLKM